MHATRNVKVQIPESTKTISGEHRILGDGKKGCRLCAGGMTQSFR